MWQSLLQLIKRFFGVSEALKAQPAELGNVRILKHAQAMRVIFFYPGEEGTYVDQPTVTLFENGIVHIRAKNEETTTHLSHCEILWRYELPENQSKKGGEKAGEKANGNVRVLKFRPRDTGTPSTDPGQPT